MTPSPLIREASALDATAVNTLLAEADLAPVGPGDGPGRYFVAEEKGRIIGVVRLERYGESGLLRSAAVDRHSRSRGIGRALVEAVIAEARSAGLSEIVLLTTTAAEWFRRLGFSALDRSSLRGEILASSQTRGGCPSTAVIMRFPLPGASPARRP